MCLLGPGGVITRPRVTFPEKYTVCCNRPFGLRRISQLSPLFLFWGLGVVVGDIAYFVDKLMRTQLQRVVVEMKFGTRNATGDEN
jgi:hypothetical protein